MVRSATPRPFLKWAGGKTQLLHVLLRHMPSNFKRYHEPFVGGGALFFALYRLGRLHQAFLSDLNAELIDTYVAVRDHVEQVIGLLAQYPHSAEFFYELRAQDPWAMSLTDRAARMIYLNKTCFNGLYRVNKTGGFNSPFGKYKSPNYCDGRNLRAASQALQDVEITRGSFESILDQARPGDLVYFDPPYDPLSATASFVGYQSQGFSRADQERLRDVCLKLTELHVQVILSNSATEYIKTIYSSEVFAITPVQAGRAISSKAESRGKLTELLVVNYPNPAKPEPKGKGVGRVFIC
jgi:DNA adenine methylase